MHGYHHPTRSGDSSNWRRHRKALLVLGTLLLYFVVWILHALVAINNHESEHIGNSGLIGGEQQQQRQQPHDPFEVLEVPATHATLPTLPPLQHHRNNHDDDNDDGHQQHNSRKTHAPRNRHRHTPAPPKPEEDAIDDENNTPEPPATPKATHRPHRRHRPETVAPTTAAAADPTPAPTHAKATHRPHRRHRAPDAKPTDAPPVATEAPHQSKAPQAHHQRRHHHRQRAFNESEVIDIEDIVAFSVVVSNEDFIDGALTLAWSFRNHSLLFQTKKAHLVAIVAEGTVSPASVKRLQLAGWTETYVLPDLTKEAPDAHWAATFNKLYLFNLTRYSRVAYFDVDMLMLRNPDSIFKVVLPDSKHIGALGNNPKTHKPYFQSGMMVIVPSTEAFDWMMNEFRTNPKHRSINGRDGAIIRKYYEDRYVQLDDAFSAHLGVHEPLDTVIGFHFRGQWKPWFDREKPPTEPDRFVVTKKPQPMQEMGEAYRLWWHCYEDLHRNVFQSTEPATATYNPKLQVWLMRNTPKSYVQFLSEVDVQRRNLTYPRLSLEKTLPGETCEFVCALRQGLCSERALSFSEINNCDRLKEFYGCRSCTLDHPGAEQPGYDVGSKKCLVNPLYYKTMRPNCTAKHAHTRRLCPCIPIDAVNDKPVAYGAVYGLPSAKESGGHDPDVVADAKSNHEASGCYPSHTDYYADSGDAPCIAYLSNASNIEYLAPLGMTLWVGRTAKLMAYYKEPGVRAIVKFPQKSFPHEAQSEVIAHAVDRAAQFHRVPPTAMAFFPRQLLVDGFANFTDEALRAANENFVQEEVWNVIDHNPAYSRRADNSGDVHIGVSVQLWLHDVHRMADSVLKVPKHFLGWFAKDSSAADPDTAAMSKFPRAAEAMAELSRMFSFDFIIGNDDRSLFKNCYVVGGCERFCKRSTAALHEGNVQLVFIDQGRSMYYDKEPEGNPLSSSTASTNSSINAAFCKFPKDLVDKLQSVARDAAEGEGEGAGDAAGGGSRKPLDKLVMEAVDADAVVKLVGESKFAGMQERLEKLLRHVRNCVREHGEDFVFLQR